MTKREVLTAETAKADAWLKAYGFRQKWLDKMNQNLRRLLARSLQSELSEWGTLPPSTRDEIERDVLREVRKSCEEAWRAIKDIDWKIGVDDLSDLFSPDNCKTDYGRAVVMGLAETLKAAAHPRTKKGKK